MQSFEKARRDCLNKIDGKRAALKIMSDMNQSLKRKYIKKNLDYRKVIKGEEIDEPTNFFQQYVLDIKRDIEVSKASTMQTQPPVEE